MFQIQKENKKNCDDSLIKNINRTLLSIKIK